MNSSSIAVHLPFLPSASLHRPPPPLGLPSSPSASLLCRKLPTFSPSPFISLLGQTESNMFGPNGPNIKALFDLVGLNQSRGQIEGLYSTLCGETEVLCSANQGRREGSCSTLCG